MEVITGKKTFFALDVRGKTGRFRVDLSQMLSVDDDFVWKVHR